MRKYAKYYINICSTVAGRKVLISPKTSSHDEDESDDIASRCNIRGKGRPQCAGSGLRRHCRNVLGFCFPKLRRHPLPANQDPEPTGGRRTDPDDSAHRRSLLRSSDSWKHRKEREFRSAENSLDAAYPRFSETEVHSLRKTDAEFVLVIHTEAGIFGITYPAGHVDFFPNRGESPQPGCELTEGGATARITEIVCSHQRSCSFYGESLRNTDAFYGRACDSYEEFEAGLCSSNATVVMGYETPTTARGTFTLQTNSASPYGRGISGATYEA
ncbi:pancreatic triacylglycerol lipase-like isoform X3 [Neodiprion pinetum]|uniref:pancreatic triacylglycerol lipase-like isoform X3 n=1 Tax=Neodiprion pinetum TaxID=441929 RepID=UPI00370F9212